MPDSLADAASAPQPDDSAAQTLMGLKAQRAASPAPKRARSSGGLTPQSVPGGEADTISVGGSSAYSAATGLPRQMLGQTDTAALAGALDLARVQARGSSSAHLMGEAKLLTEYLQDARPPPHHGHHLARSALHSPPNSSNGHDRSAFQGGTKRSAQEAFDSAHGTAELLNKLSSEGLNLAVEAAAAASSVSALLPQVLQQSMRGDVTGALHALGSSMQSVVSRQARMAAHMLHLQRAAVAVLQYARANASGETAGKHNAAASAAQQQGDPRGAEPRPPSPPASTLSGRTLRGAPQPPGGGGWHINTSTAASDAEGGLHDMSPLPGPALGNLPSVGSASVDGAAEAAAAAPGGALSATAAVHDSPNFKALFSAVDKVTASHGNGTGS